MPARSTMGKSIPRRPEYHGVAIAIALISLVFDGVSGTHLRGDVSKIVAAMDDSLADG